MDIRNSTEFRNFINVNQLRGLDTAIDAVAICILDYERQCDCWKAGDRQKVYDNCNRLYENAVTVVANKFSVHFLNHTVDQSITFYLNGRIIGSIRR